MMHNCNCNCDRNSCQDSDMDMSPECLEFMRVLETLLKTDSNLKSIIKLVKSTTPESPSRKALLSLGVAIQLSNLLKNNLNQDCLEFLPDYEDLKREIRKETWEGHHEEIYKSLGII